MVVDTTYYDLLRVAPDCDSLTIKKAYRKMAVLHHPDKNPNTPQAHEKFQEISEAYQVLSDDELRKRYDKFGKEKSMPAAGFEDASEFFSMIFGGDAFVDLIGEISLMKDMLKTADITMAEEMAEAEKSANDTAAKFEKKSEQEGDSKANLDAEFEQLRTSSPAAAEGTTSAECSGISTPSRPQITAMGEEDSHFDPSNMTEEEKNIRKSEKKKGKLTKEQQAKLDELEAERLKAREERVDALTKKLVCRLSVWTETDKGSAVTEAFKAKQTYESEHLKMESFGIELLHTIGFTYMQKGTTLLKSQKFLGISGFFSRVKEKGTFVKETWGTISAALDAQMTVEEMAKREEKGEEWTDEKKAEFERKLTGKVLNAAWQASRYEIQSVLREVCDRVLGDKQISAKKRIERAEALVMVGVVFSEVRPDPDEAEDARVFESLLADAQRKKTKRENKKEKATSKERDKDKRQSRTV